MFIRESHKKNIFGNVIVNFLKGKDGKIKKAEVEKGNGHGCDEEALRVVKLLDEWEVPMQDGKLVEVWMSLPIHFRMK